MTYRRKLIEVALPLQAINEASAQEKAIRHGHPSTLHLWWARRPLATCRAVLFASLVNDPSDDPMYGVNDDIAAGERAKLFNLIEELVRWENSTNPRVINAARAEIARSIAANKVADGEWTNDRSIVNVDGKAATAHDFKHKLAGVAQVNAFLVEHAPPVLDPFCGGGSIPLEAQRLGLRAYGSDLNPVPVLITKALIEIPPKFAGIPPVNPEYQEKSSNAKAATVWHAAQGLAEDVRYYGQWIRDEAEKRIGHLYPKVEVTALMAHGRPDLLPYVGHHLTVIAWLWARTVASANPTANGAHVPLVRSFWLSTKKEKSTFVLPVVDRATNTFQFRVQVGKPADGFDPGAGTVNRRGARCILTGDPVPFPHIRLEGQAGRMKVRLMAVVAEGNRGRVYLSPDHAQVEIANSAQPTWQPDAALPDNPRDFKTPNYGMTTFAALFTPRQLVVLTTFCDLVAEVRQRIKNDGAEVGWSADQRSLIQSGVGPAAYSDAVATYLAFSLSRSVDRSSTICTWDSSPKMEALRNTFARQAMPMTWDYAEGNPFSDSSGNWLNNVEWVAKTIEKAVTSAIGNATQLDATAAVSELTSPVISTDPPYYDNIGYADLSDFFYVWLRRSLSDVYPSLLATVLTPKSQELIATPYRHDGNKDRAKAFFESGFVKAFGKMRELNHIGFPLTVYYAFKQTETDDETNIENDSIANTSTASTGWETMLEGLIRSGFGITGTWPMRTELGNRMIGSGTNALASSIILVCRPRPDTAALATRKDFITALRNELPDALRHLQRGNIAPVDFAQAAIGPGMAVFTRYAKVIESDGAPMTVRMALGIINQVLDEVLAEQEGDFDPDTRWALAWFEQFGTSEGQYGIAETLSKAKNTAINGLVEAGVVKAKSGKVQLVSRGELPDEWNPTADKRLTVWETAQHLIRTLEMKGEAEAAILMNKLGGIGETARELAYRLYSICEKKKWADEALAYNSLVIAWPELSKLALANRNRQQPTTQAELFT